MIEWDWITLAMCALGFAAHFTARWAEFWRTGEHIGPLAYVKLDPPGWLAAILATAGTYLMLPEAPALLGGAGGLTPFNAFAAGYMGSSIGAKLPALFGRTAGVR